MRKKEFEIDKESEKHEGNLATRRESDKEKKAIRLPIAKKLKALRSRFKDDKGKTISQSKFAQKLMPFLDDPNRFKIIKNMHNGRVLSTIDIGKETVSQLECAGRTLTKEFARAYHKLCGVSLEYLYGVTDKSFEVTYGLNEKSLGVLSTAVYKMAEAEEDKQEYLELKKHGLVDDNFVFQYANTINGINILLDQDYAIGEVRVLDALMNFVNSKESNLTELTNAVYCLKAKELRKNIEARESRKKEKP